MVGLDTPLSEIRGIGPKFLVKLKHFNIETVRGLLWHFPFRYEDFSKFLKIADLKINEYATIQGEIKAVKIYRTWKKRMFILEALISDDTGSIKAIWFNQRFLITVLKKGKLVNLAGKVSEDQKGGLSISHPIYELISESQIIADKEADKRGYNISDNPSLDPSKSASWRHTGRVVPVYPETKGLTSKAFRYLIKPLLEKLEEITDPIPEEIIEKEKLMGINEAIYKVHFPEKIEEAKEAKKRFAFEDLFFLQLSNIIQRLKLSKEKAHSTSIELDKVKNLLSKLPFELTFSQKKSLWEILKDLEKSHPMNRLLQGDVGSGKTIVAVLATLAVVDENKPFNVAQGRPFDITQGRQVAIMAPTEVLTVQHYQTFKKFFSGFNAGVGLLTSSNSKVFYGDDLESSIKKPELVSKISSGEIKIVFGTHALIQKYVKFKELAFVVIDEQHRFGVKQRASLLRDPSGKPVPHLLSMSATPIPRTLSLTVFGDLDLSIIDELPKGRKEIITKIVAPENRDKAYAFIRGQVKKGRQVFVICPRIEPSQISETEIISEEELAQLKFRTKRSILAWETKAVKEEYEKLSNKTFPDLKVAMIHGKLKAKEKNEVMQKFKEGETDILVSTSVVEVGVDVPNATIMMIEGSDKFGLAQLYQFRGRVGRDKHQSFCFLFSDSQSKFVYNRLQSLIDAKNGFELAEKDLAIRGPGEFLGEAQTGMPDLAMKAVKNPNLVKSAREAAQEIIKKNPSLKSYPELKSRLEEFRKEIHLE